MRQYVPFARLSELVENITGISMSQGTIYNLLNKTADAVLPIYDAIKENIDESEIIPAKSSIDFRLMYLLLHLMMGKLRISQSQTIKKMLPSRQAALKGYSIIGFTNQEIRSLLDENIIQLKLFSNELAEVEYQGERYMLSVNAELHEQEWSFYQVQTSGCQSRFLGGVFHIYQMC